MCTVASEILDPKEVAQLLKISVRTVTRLAEKNELEGFKIGDMWRFYRSDIDAYIETQKLKRKAKEEQKQQEGSE